MDISRLAIRLTTLAAIAACSGAALAFFSPKIDLDRPADSPTMTVRYSGAKVALIELRINGRSVATRDMTSESAQGETTFDLDAALLEDGDNRVEVLLFDSSGKQLGSQEAVVTREAGDEGPATIAMPRPGATVQGPVEIRVGVNRQLRGIFVSFFINDEFRSLRNFPPYTYYWDTTRVPNGWHDLEAWVVDESNQTFRTRRVRVFVNNPGGRTNRETAPVTAPAHPRPTPAVPIAKPQARPTPPRPAKPPVSPAPTVESAARTQLDLTLANNPLVPIVADTGAGLRSMMEVHGGAPISRPVPPTAPADARALSAGIVRGATGPTAGVKPTPLAAGVTAGPKLLTPNRMTVARAVPAVAPSISTTQGTARQIEMVRITYGQRLRGVSSFAVLLRGEMVEFDVAPRVVGEVPMTPFRHLLEKAGGEVRWDHEGKSVRAQAEGRGIFLRIGDRTAWVGERELRLELAPYLDSGRTIVPLSFIGEALNVHVDYDPATGHVLITSAK